MTRIEASLPPRWHLIEPSPVIRGIMRFISVRTAWLGPKLILIFNVNQLVAIAFFHTDVPYTSFRPPLRQSPAVPHSQHISNGSKYTYLVSEDETGRRQRRRHRSFPPASSGVHWAHPCRENRGCDYNLHYNRNAETVSWVPPQPGPAGPASDHSPPCLGSEQLMLFICLEREVFNKALNAC